jgi:hypothetical protein
MTSTKPWTHDRLVSKEGVLNPGLSMIARRAAFQDILELGCCNCNASDFWSKIDAAAIRDVGVSNR